jgi:hypothetical protein
MAVSLGNTASGNVTVERHAATPGPWRWEVSLKSKSIQLCGGRPRFDLTVMDFVRWGMGGARPRFLKPSEHIGMLMTDAEEFAVHVEGREHHADWFQSLDHPDAHLIAAAPDLYEAAKHAVMEWRLHGQLTDSCRVLERAIETAEGRGVGRGER